MFLPNVHPGNHWIFVTLDAGFVRVTSSNSILLKDPDVPKVFQFDADLPLRCVTRFVFVHEIETSDRVEVGRLFIKTLELRHNLLPVLPILRDGLSLHVHNIVIPIIVVGWPRYILRHFVRRDKFCARKYERDYLKKKKREREKFEEFKGR